MNEGLTDPELRELDGEVTREAGALYRRFWIGLIIGALVGLAIPIADFLIQTVLLPLNPITVCGFAVFGGIIGLLTSSRGNKEK